MDDAASPPLLLAYTAWRAEAARISDIAQAITADERLSSLLKTVATPTAANAAEAAAPSSTSFFSQLFSSASRASSATAAAAAVPWCASLAQLLALAELPPGQAGETSAPSGVRAPPPPPTVSRRNFAHIIAAVANSGSNSSSGGGGGGDAANRSASFTTVSFTSQESGERLVKSSSFNSSSGLGAAAQKTPYTTGDDDDDDDNNGGFDRTFARLKQQAIERRQQQQQQQQANGRSANTSAVPRRLSAGDINRTNSSTLPSPAAHSGLSAARLALNAADALLLRVRQQNQLSTAASGRITEAQTRLVRASVCREAITYTDQIVHAVDALLQPPTPSSPRDLQAGSRRGSQGAIRRSDNERGRSSSAAAAGDLRARDTTRAWAAAVAADAPRALCALVQCEGTASAAASTPSLLSPHRVNTSADPHRRSFANAGSRIASPPSTSAFPTNAAVTGVSPAYASGTNFYHTSPVVTPNNTTAAAASRSALPHELKVVLLQWRQLVSVQQRALRWSEVHDYVAASRLFLGAAAERSQLGGQHMAMADGGTGRSVRAALAQSPVADLAAHGFTHLLRACGILLEDPLLEQEVAYGPSLLEEVALLLREQSERQGGVKIVLPPPLLSTPHAPRVWLLLSQLAGFLERHHLVLPWEARSEVRTAHHSPVPLLEGPTATIQMLWEVAAAVLLCRTEDALRALQSALHRTATSATKAAASVPYTSTSLHDLFPFTSAGQEALSLPAVQPGTLPLCLHALRHACAAAAQGGRFAAALHTAEIALLLLAEAAVTTIAASTAVQAGRDASDTAPSSTESVVDYRKVANWSARPSPSPLALMEPTVHFHLLRVLLLLLSAPLTAGDAATLLLRQGELLRPTPAEVAKVEEENDTTAAAAAAAAKAARGPGEAAEKLGGCVAGVPVVASSGTHTAAADVAAVLRQTLTALQGVACHLRVSEGKDNGFVCGLRNVHGGDEASTRRRDGAQLLHGRALRCSRLPPPHLRLGAVLQKVSSDGDRSGSTDLVSSPAVVEAPAERETTINNPKRRVACRLLSSTQYQRLKRSHQPPQQQQEKKEEGTSLALTEGVASAPAHDDVASSQVEPPLPLTAASATFVHTETDSAAEEREEEEKEDNETPSASLTAAMEDLQQIVKDLLVVVCLLTMPLRASSTCTLTPKTALPILSSIGGGRHSEDAAKEERGYDRPCAQAQQALHAMEGRLEKCLRVLGARDRTIFVLLRRLRHELLFPAVCRPLV